MPTTADITTTTVPSTATQAGITGLSGQADGTLTYVLTALPANGTLLYNNGGAYTAITSTGQTLTGAQAASLRYNADPSYTGPNTAFTYQLKDDAGQTSNTSTYPIPLQYCAPCTTATATLDFSTRTSGED